MRRAGSSEWVMRNNEEYFIEWIKNKSKPGSTTTIAVYKQTSHQSYWEVRYLITGYNQKAFKVKRYPNTRREAMRIAFKWMKRRPVADTSKLGWRGDSEGHRKAALKGHNKRRMRLEAFIDEQNEILREHNIKNAIREARRR